MSSKLTLKSRDKGYAAVTKRIYGLGKTHLRVGITASAGAEPKREHDGTTSSKVTVVMVATWMEFGTSTIPARSFIRAWFDENEAPNKVLIASALRAVARGAIAKDKALALLGQKFVAGIQKRIADGIPPVLAESTIKRKGSDKPLIDTGQLRSSITYEVVI